MATGAIALDLQQFGVSTVHLHEIVGILEQTLDTVDLQRVACCGLTPFALFAFSSV